MREDRFGFRKVKNRRDTTVWLRMLGKRILEVNCEMYVRFINWEKTFDRFYWNSILKIFKDAAKKDRGDRRLKKELYA